MDNNLKSAIQRVAESRLRECITTLEKIMPPKMGIGILTWEHNTAQGHVGYISNAARPGMRRAMAELMERWKNDQAGKSFFPLTLDGFESWIRSCAELAGGADSQDAVMAFAPVLIALNEYRDMSNTVEGSAEVPPGRFRMRIVANEGAREWFDVPTWLKSCDHEAMDGRGLASLTTNKAEAMTFQTAEQLIAFWIKVPRARAVREDGKPNKPLTAYSIEVDNG